LAAEITVTGFSVRLLTASTASLTANIATSQLSARSGHSNLKLEALKRQALISHFEVSSATPFYEQLAEPRRLRLA